MNERRKLLIVLGAAALAPRAALAQSKQVSERAGKPARVGILERTTQAKYQQLERTFVDAMPRPAPATHVSIASSVEGTLVKTGTADSSLMTISSAMPLLLEYNGMPFGISAIGDENSAPRLRHWSDRIHKQL